MVCNKKNPAFTARFFFRNYLKKAGVTNTDTLLFILLSFFRLFAKP